MSASCSSTSSSSDPSLYWVQQCATGFLGYGYSPEADPAQRISSQGGISQDEHDLTDLIQVTTLPIFEVFSIGATKAKAMRRLAERIYEMFPGAPKEEINPFEGDFIDISDEWLLPPQTAADARTTCKYYFATAIIKAYRCELNSVSSLPQTTGETIITAGWVFTGYKILFEIHIPISSLKNHFSPYTKRPKAWHQNLSIEKLDEILTEHPILGIQFSAHCYGNYPVSLDSPLSESTQLLPFLKDFREKHIPILSKMVLRNFLIDITCNKINTTPFNPSDTSSLSPSGLKRLPRSTLSDKKIELLAERIQRHSAKQIQLIDPKELYRLLKETYRVFYKVLLSTKNNPKSISDHYSLFLCESGIGNSTIIASLLGQPLEIGKIPSPLRLDRTRKCLIPPRENCALPRIGHSNSCTQGFNVHQQFIDTASTFSTAGTEKDTCNIAAISLAIKTYSPKNIVYLLSGGEFFGSKFHSTLHKLWCIFYDLSQSTQLSSLLFLINKRDGYLKTEELEKIIEDRDFNRSDIAVQGPVQTIISRLKSENFLFVDPTSSASLKQFDRWESTHRSFSVEKFNQEQFFYRDAGDFNSFLNMFSAIIHYYFTGFSDGETNTHKSMLDLLISHDDFFNHLNEYRDFWRTIAMIIRRLDLFDKVDEKERKTYREFCARYSD